MKKIKNIFRDGNQRFKVITDKHSLNEVLIVAIEMSQFNTPNCLKSLQFSNPLCANISETLPNP